MPVYKCEKCGKNFTTKTMLTRHLNKKFSCIQNSVYDQNGGLLDPKKSLHFMVESIKNDPPSNYHNHSPDNEILALPCKVNKKIKNMAMDPISYITSVQNAHYHNTKNDIKKVLEKGVNTIICSFCQKPYKTKMTLERHIKNCPKRPLTKKDIGVIESKVKSSIINTISKSETSDINNITNNQTITNNTVNNTVNNTQNIFIVNNASNEMDDKKLLPFGKEDIEHLTNDLMKNIISQPEQGIIKLIQQVHFNDEMPQNHNIQIGNKKEPFVEIFNGEKWEKHDKKIALQNIITTKKDIMDDYFDEQVEKNILSTFIKKNYETFSELLDSYVRESLNAYDDNVKNRVVRKCLLLYKHICRQADLLLINNKRKSGKNIGKNGEKQIECIEIDEEEFLV